MENSDVKNKIFNRLVTYINYNNNQILGIFLFILVIIFSIPIALISTAICKNNLEIATTGQMVDTIGGIANPLVAIVAIFFSFLAFYMQLKANRPLS